MKRVSLIVFCLLIVSMASITAQKYEVSVKKIWDNGSHCACLLYTSPSPRD